MNKIAFIYPGQGAQKAGMGKDFYENSEMAKELYDKATELLQIDMRALCFEENEKLDLTEYTQVAIVTTSMVMTKELEKRGIKPDVTAGLSLGEYCAICAAGGMKEEEAISLVRKRGILMQNAVPAGEGTMAAVLGMESEEILDIIEKIDDVAIANYNCPGQIVISGKTQAVQLAAKHLKAAGAKRAVTLNVSGPFHSPMLQEAGEQLKKEMKGIEFTELQIPYVTNVTAEYIYESDRIKELLAKQVYSPVRWQEGIERMIAEGVDVFIEVGPGKTLSGFLKKINQDVKVYHVGSWNDVEQVVKELKTQEKRNV